MDIETTPEIVKALADGLTYAQATELVMGLCAFGNGGNCVCASPSVALFRSLGLANSGSWAGASLTPLGQAVRAHLQESRP